MKSGIWELDNSVVEKCEIRSEKDTDGNIQHRIWCLLHPYIRTRYRDGLMMKTDEVFKTREEAEKKLKKKGFKYLIIKEEE